MTPATVHIAAVSDKNYAQHLAVMLVSLFATTTTTHNKHIHIIDAGIDEGDKKELVRIVEGSGSAISFYNIDDRFYDSLRVDGHISKAAYYRISIPSLLHIYPKVLYLDCDILFVDDVDKIYTRELGTWVVGAVTDVGDVTHGHLGIPRRELYFNSGVLLFNTEAWRVFLIDEKIKKALKTIGSKIILHDQDILNAVLWDNRLDLGFEVNPHVALFYDKDGVKNSNYKEIYKSSILLHFCSSQKPWHYGCPHPYRKLYFKYIKKTKWCGYKITRPTLKSKLSKIYKNKVPHIIQYWVRKNILDKLGLKENLLGTKSN